MANFTPIGLYRCPQTYRYEAPRQGVFSGNEGVVELNEGAGFEDPRKWSYQTHLGLCGAMLS